MTLFTYLFDTITGVTTHDAVTDTTTHHTTTSTNFSTIDPTKLEFREFYASACPHCVHLKPGIFIKIIYFLIN